MAALALSALLLLAFTGSSSANWCVCKDGSDTILQKTLDYACGAGADCNPLHQGGACFNPSTVRAHCNYAVNSYFQRKGQAQGSCDFAGTATVTASDPSTAGCTYPTSASNAGTSTSPVTTTPSTTSPTTGTPSTPTGTPSTPTGTPSTPTGTPSTTTGTPSTTTGTTTTTPSSSSSSTTPTTATPFGSTPGVLGGIGNGMGPSGSGMNTDDSHGVRLVDSSLFSPFSAIIFSGVLMLWWG